MDRLLPGLLLAPLALAPLAAAQERSFPMDAVGLDPDRGIVRWEPRLEAVRELRGFERVWLRDVLLPDGALVDLDLERVDLARRRFGVQVDGAPRPDLLAGLQLSAWKGTVVGEPASSVRLSFSTAGFNGWIQRAGSLVHVLSTASEVLFVTEAALVRQGFGVPAPCVTLPGGGSEAPPTPPPALLDGLTDPAVPGGCTMRNCAIAVETDTELNTVVFGGDLNAEALYVLTLLAYVSDVYETQVDTVLTFPYVQFYTGNDPWTPEDGDAIDMLVEFGTAWNGNIPAGAQLGHFISGEVQGGVAWVDVLDMPDWSFAVSGSITGDTPFPVVQGPLTWDFKVVTHETGHNFGTLHTHDYCPPIDQCGFGLCNDQVVHSEGTIMSYCHLGQGDMSDIKLEFHWQVAELLTQRANEHLPLFSGIEGDAPPVIPEGQPTEVFATVVGFPAGDVELYYRYDGGNFVSVAMQDEGGGIYSAELPAPECSDEPEYYYAYTDAACGGVTDPEEAGGVHRSEVGELKALLVDDFENDLGWTTDDAALAGWWERGVPVNDWNYKYDPFADYDGSGQCFLTWNADGETDVDGGTVRLISPQLDCSGGLATISYAYFLYLEDYFSTDALTVAVSSNGLNGPWKEVAHHDANGGTYWWTNTITHQDLANAGVAMTADVRLRFSANDSSPQGMVEAAVDAVEVHLLVCEETIGASYCGPAVINSSGQPGRIEAFGSALVSDDDVTLVADQLPANQYGYFLVSQVQGFVTNPGGSMGNLCLGGAIGRYSDQAQSSGPDGRIVLPIDLSAIPTPTQSVAVQPGETWNFQCWFRDVVAGPTSNFTDGVSILFL